MEEDNEHHISKTFYKWQFSTTLLWWVTIRLATGKNLYDITNGSVCTRPSWIPIQYLHYLQRPSRRRAIFLLSLFALAIGGWGSSSSFVVRLIVAIIFSLYHLVESSVTHRHGEYPLLYNVWAMCLCSSSEYASAVSFGIAVHFILSTGLAKIVVGGQQWMLPSTMRFYLSAYYGAKMKLSRPFLPSWNRWTCQRSWATSGIAVATILFECVVVPLTLFLPINTRHIGCTGMILMHIGIFLLMSKQVGIVFITTISTYIVGFQCSALIGTGPWWSAVLVSFLPNLICLGPFATMIPENWPLSAVSLFMWNGGQAKLLAETLMTGETRVVLATAEKSTPQSIVGLPVIHHGAVAPRSGGTVGIHGTPRGADRAVHDSVLRVIGFTLLQENLLPVVPRATASIVEDPWDMQKFLVALQTFLQTKQRLFETQSGLPLQRAYYVQIGANGNVEEVLLSA
ncbi:expressed unknown protein [Seminavis robusta]|uniref:Uncharacterized protein n=1 Tax=Seminavis robusta TaxID=568900 RepID=A0A9N8DNQ0_9STRA|nr:expressed unknown protein [Seminavis robusta]|eukprot:Sro263_g102370.1 n/a (455) ;mRNA; r:71967-73331